MQTATLRIGAAFVGVSSMLPATVANHEFDEGVTQLLRRHQAGCHPDRFSGAVDSEVFADHVGAHSPPTPGSDGPDRRHRSVTRQERPRQAGGQT